ncbi:hypothetical protein G9A89_001671 [Geosiphon pyriformis]|nr:hypothetical protein G9A89_001671 [Geosiphon pyriformis]
MNIQLCKEYIMPYDNKWCSECYALSILLFSKNDQEEIEFEEHKPEKEITTTPIYFIKNQPAIQLKYFDNNGKRIKPEKAHEINARYDLRYPEAIVQIASQSLLASKEINVRGGIIDTGYIKDTTIMLQNETNKPFRIKHAKKIAQAIYLPLINISDLQSVNNREQLEKSEKGTQDFGSTEQFTVLVNIALNIQNESYQIL